MTEVRNLTLTTVMVVLALSVGALGCEKSEDGDRDRHEAEKAESESAARSGGVDEKSSGGEEAAPSDESGWERVDEGSLDDSRREVLERARSAQKALGKTLKKELQSAVSEKSFSGAVDFCHTRAPEIADEVADEHGVAIGRTSHRLRNPDNAPPEWAEQAVDREKAREYVYRGPDEKLGYMRPIKLKGLCTNCHGKKKQLAPGVSKALQKHYPEDEATGFEVGDLRGWFWVEVDPSS